MKALLRWIGQIFENFAQQLGNVVRRIPPKYQFQVLRLDWKLETLFCRIMAVIMLLLAPFLGLLALFIGALSGFVVTILQMLRSYWQAGKKGNSDG